MYTLLWKLTNYSHKIENVQSPNTPLRCPTRDESLLCGLKHKACVRGPLLLWIQTKCSYTPLFHISTVACAPTWPLAAGGKLCLVALQEEVRKYKVGVKLSEATLSCYVQWMWSQSASDNVSSSLPCSSLAWLFLGAFHCTLLWWEKITACSKFLPCGFGSVLQNVSSLEMFFFLKQCYQSHLVSKPTRVSAILLYIWVLQTPNWCGWFSDFLVLNCFLISTSCNSLHLLIVFWVPRESQKLRISIHQL